MNPDLTTRLGVRVQARLRALRAEADKISRRSDSARSSR